MNDEQYNTSTSPREVYYKIKLLLCSRLAIESDSVARPYRYA